MKKNASVLMLMFFVSAALAADRQIVTKNIVVENGDTLKIAPGKELLFDAYTGITVMGHLKVAGTKQNPVTFASVNDTAGSATPFDWNGIEIFGSGSAELTHTLIANAMSGITASSPHSLTLTECIFKDNGQWHLSIGGEIQDVTTGQPYNCKSPAGTPSPVAAAEPSGVRDNRRAWRWVLGGTGAAAAIGGTVSLFYTRSINNEYSAYKPGNTDYDNATEKERQRKYDKLRSNYGTAQILGWSLLGLAAADLLVLVIWF